MSKPSRLHQVRVLNKPDAESLLPIPGWVVISVCDHPGTRVAQLQPGWGPVLRLAFHDKEDEVLAAMTGLWKLFSEDQARAVWTFVEENRETAKGLLVHCDAGLSRSPAIAREIASHLGLPADPEWPQGNLLVRSRLRSYTPA